MFSILLKFIPSNLVTFIIILLLSGSFNIYYKVKLINTEKSLSVTKGKLEEAASSLSSLTTLVEKQNSSIAKLKKDFELSHNEYQKNMAKILKDSNKSSKRLEQELAILKSSKLESCELNDRFIRSLFLLEVNDEKN